jgi:hypothetical protein
MSECRWPVLCSQRGCQKLCARSIGTATDIRPRQNTGSRALYRVLGLRGHGETRRVLLAYQRHVRADGSTDSRATGRPAYLPVWLSAARFHVHLSGESV